MTGQAAVGEKSGTASIFWRFWLAMAVSEAGTAMTVVALPLLAVTVLEASILEVTLLSAAGRVAWLILGLPAGVVAQRFPLRTLQVTLDLVRFVAVGSIPVAWWLGQLAYSQLLLVALVTGCATVLFWTANSTFLPSIVDKKELTSRNSLISGTDAVNQTGGPSLSGLLIQLASPVVVLLIDACSYLVSALTLRSLPESRPEAPPRGRITVMIRDGWRFVVGHPVMRPCMLWATTVNFVNTALMTLTPLYLVREVGASAGVVGIVVAFDGIGALIGSAVAARLARRLGTARAMITASLGGGTLTLLIPLTTGLASVWCYALGFAGWGFGVVVGSILTRTHRQTESPPELLSRVMATVKFVSWGAMPLGAGFGGLLASSLGLRPGLWVVCAGALVAPVLLLLSPVRKRRNLGSEQDENP